jgi:hypothetical protein
VWFICASVLISILLPTLDTNDTKSSKEGEVFEYQEEEHFDDF